MHYNQDKSIILCKGIYRAALSFFVFSGYAATFRYAYVPWQYYETTQFTERHIFVHKNGNMLHAVNPPPEYVKNQYDCGASEVFVFDTVVKTGSFLSRLCKRRVRSIYRCEFHRIDRNGNLIKTYCDEKFLKSQHDKQLMLHLFKNFAKHGQIGHSIILHTRIKSQDLDCFTRWFGHLFNNKIIFDKIVFPRGDEIIPICLNGVDNGIGFRGKITDIRRASV